LGTIRNETTNIATIKTTNGNAPAPYIGPIIFNAIPATIPIVIPSQTQIKLVIVCLTFKPWVKKRSNQ